MYILKAQILTPIPSTGFMYNPHMGRLKNLTCFEVFCLFSIFLLPHSGIVLGHYFLKIRLRQELLFWDSAEDGVKI